MKKKINVDDTSIHEVNDIFDTTNNSENLSRHDERIKSQMEQEHKDIEAMRKGPIPCDLYERIVEKYNL